MLENNDKLIDKRKVKKDKIDTDVTRKDIEKSYNIDSNLGTEAYFSDRYGWTLRKKIK